MSCEAVGVELQSHVTFPASSSVPSTDASKTRLRSLQNAAARITKPAMTGLLAGSAASIVHVELQARVMLRFSAYVPGCTLATAPAGSVSTACCTVRQGALDVPGF